MHCRACTASCYQMAVTASVAGERYPLVCFCLACSVPVLAQQASLDTPTASLFFSIWQVIELVEERDPLRGVVAMSLTKRAALPTCLLLLGVFCACAGAHLPDSFRRSTPT